jgi:micrococcal nuclease
VRVIDGDSLIIGVGGYQYRIELDGIDAPELNQPWGERAAQTLHSDLTGIFVIVRQTGHREGGTIRGQLHYAGRDAALTQLRAGLAWAVEPTDAEGHPTSYGQAEQQARQSQLGLWSQAEPIPPWTWRGDPPPENGMLEP